MTWEGNRALRKLLAPVGELRPHPRNPRLGNVYEIGLSLERFGQQRPVLALPDGTIIAGHHVYQAAVAREWTHVAVIRSDLTDDEVEGYLLADNGTADRGYYDETQLATLLGQWEDTAGTGFSTEEAQSIVRAMMWMPDEMPVAARGGSPAEQPLAQGTATAFNIVLTYEGEAYERVTAQLDRLVDGQPDDRTYSDAVRRAILG